MKSIIIAIISLSLTTGMLKAQNYDAQVRAFQESYLSEASGDFSTAIESLRSIYKEDSYEINLRLGYLTYLNGNFTESTAYYNKAINLMPYGIEARFGYVLPVAAMGNYSQVIKQYEKILEITPNNSIAMHRMGLIYYGRKDFATAEKLFEKVVNLYPFDYDALTMLAWTKFNLGNTREAKVLFYKALLNTPSGSSAAEGLELLSTSGQK
jgi:tetratricopeptide (TPR) repeat protein